MKIIIMLSGVFLLPHTGLQAQRNHQTYDSIVGMMQQADFMQEEIPDKLEKPPLSLRSLSADTMQTIARHKSYDYMQYIDSVLQARNAQTPPTLPRKEADAPAHNWFSLGLWILAIGSAIFVFYQLLRNRSPFRKAAARQRHEHGPAEIIPTGMHNKLIEDAMARRDYRMAVRYLFLDALNALAAGGHVQLMAEKTNHQYLSEIADPSLRQAFRPLVMHYEYTWYGEFTPGEQQFNQILSSFHTFTRSWF